MQTTDQNFRIHRVPARVILPLRAAVLRPNHPLTVAMFEQDLNPATVHLAGWDDAQPGLLACATAHFQPYVDTQPAYQLRGMAVAESHRGLGLGRQLIDDLVRRLAHPHGPNLLWCNARVTALDFYHRCGWHVDSSIFDIADVGPHRRMVRSLIV